ncbi:MAG: PHP domain-containing protein [Cyanobacteria bacterium CRU_2_1]|nr:PHP domain-containing protein [Cyanobacteria bacterium RU_5_0]NJR59917.1 PHP domain-containing protein [Cyanobacteria bacterium CRU_2_1]
MAIELAQGAASLAARDAIGLKRVFEGISAESCPRFFNFHIHTIHSDGRLQPEQVIEQAIAIGLRGLTITDHHSVNGYRKAQQWLNEWLQSFPDLADSTPRFWTGAEINADLLDIEVHILAYAFNPDHVAIQPYLQGCTVTGEAYRADRVIAAIHAANGLAVLAHPVRYKRSPVDLIPAAAQLGIDGLETYYAYNNPSPWHPSPQQTKQVQTLGESHGLLNTCGTDTHGLSLLQRL